MPKQILSSRANGLSFLLLNADGCIRSDYQFNPAANEASEIVDRYLAAWSEPDANARSRRIEELWSREGLLVSETAVRKGQTAIAEEVTRLYETHGARGRRVWSAYSIHVHHDLVKFKWRIAGDAAGAAIATGTDLLILDNAGRISCDYRFDEPM